MTTNSTKSYLLLIEDDYDVAEMLLMYFESHEFEVLHADHGHIGIELARTRFPTLILLDLMLPDMEGYDVCLRLRNMALTKYIPIIFLTQRDERASKVRGLELGADDYITKPFDIDELRLRVQGSIRRATRENLHEPRTGLPTGELVEEELHRRHENQNYAELVYRPAGWQAYNDMYGFVAGNSVLKFAAKTLQTVVSEMGSSNDFVGILEDDFIVLTDSTTADKLDQTIKKRFSEQVRAFYSFADAERGGILLHADTPHEELVPLMYFESEKRLAAST